MTRVRCTVESMQYSACGMRIGDWFEIDEDGLRLPEGGSFCWFAIASALPALLSGSGPLAGCRSIACPDPPEALVMRVDVSEPT